MTTLFSMPVTVVQVDQLTPAIKSFVFERIDGQAFSPFSAGSHVVVSMGDGENSHKNPYSLVGNSDDFMQYRIAVQA